MWTDTKEGVFLDKDLVSVENDVVVGAEVMSDGQGLISPDLYRFVMGRLYGKKVSSTSSVVQVRMGSKNCALF